MSCFCRNRDTTSGPNVNETPRSFSLQPVMSLSGSDHSKSQSRPQSGIYTSQPGDIQVSAGPNRSRVSQNERATYIGRTHDTTDLLHRVQVRTQASMHGEDLLINDGCDWQAVEAIRECLPQFDVVPPLTFIIEAVDPIDRCTLVVAP